MFLLLQGNGTQPLLAFFDVTSLTYLPPLLTQGVPIMTLESVKSACVENGGYETPELNETLFLSFKGYRSITPEISAFTGALVLYLESNGITKIENVGI